MTIGLIKNPVTYVDRSITVRNFAANTCMSPVKSQTIPQLELIAALILSRLVVTVCNSLELVVRVEMFLWTDPTVAFYWINNHKP